MQAIGSGKAQMSLRAVLCVCSADKTVAQAQRMRPMSDASTPVAAHAAGFSIAVAIVHVKISLSAGLEHHVSVGTNAKSAVAQLGNDRFLIPMGIQALAAVNKNEIIPRALVFDK